MEPQLNYHKIDPIPSNKLVVYLNDFIINTTQFLNRFSYLCEEKLSHCHRNIQRLEITMNLLEAKLASIPELGDMPKPAEKVEVQVQEDVVPEETGYVEEEAAVALPEIEEEAKPSGLTMKDHPDYAKFFRLVALKIPASAIKQKMMIEGFNPDILDNPDAPYTPEDGEGMEAPALPEASSSLASSSDDEDSDWE